MRKTKIVIEMPTMLYLALKLDGVWGYPRLTEIIRNGKPLPEDTTNGDIFKAMFSNLTIYENRDNKDYPYVDVIIGEHDSTCYPKDWWDEQYKKGEKDETDN